MTPSPVTRRPALPDDGLTRTLLLVGIDITPEQHEKLLSAMAGLGMGPIEIVQLLRPPAGSGVGG